MGYPRIYLVLDNCFAIKRWIRPLEWMELAREIGFRYVQASTDNEIDPLFSTPEYMDDWFSEVERGTKKTGVKLANFYTGYQTYRTAGLAHHDRRIVDKLKKEWIYQLIERVEACGADGLGFSFFAIPDEAMQDPEKHRRLTDRLYDDLYDIADFAHEHGRVKVSVEQMYVPYQPPFTISGSGEFLKRAYRHAAHPLYITIDTGHAIGQYRFLRPSAEALEKSFGFSEPGVWLGSDSVYEIWHDHKARSDTSAGTAAVLAEMDKYPYLFADKRDTDPYKWLSALAKYSPIIHMQQTDGTKSSHAPFTPENNKQGIISGERLLKAIIESYEDGEEIQPPVSDIYLSFEIFAANTDTNRDIIKSLKQTLSYWRAFIPEDGMTLDHLVGLLQ